MAQACCKAWVLGLLLSLSVWPALADSSATANAALDAPATAAVRQASLSFRDLGFYNATQLRGTDGKMTLPFGVRLDEVVTKARLHLDFTWSPALLPALSHLKIMLNGEVAATVPLPQAQAGHEVISDIDLDPRLFTDYNQLSIHLIGHYTMECEDAMHSSLWASISSSSRLDLTLKPLDLHDDLALLPAPFFDRRDSSELQLPFVFAAKPSLATLRTAGVVASWFGAEAGYRGASFPALLDILPTRHAVVFATNSERPSGLDLPMVQQPTLEIIDLPANPAVKLLLVLGRDDAQLKEAADALVLGQVMLTGQRAEVLNVKYGPRRPAYDAPNWLRTDRPVKFGELVDNPGDLQATGHDPDPIKVNLRIPPDLLTWNHSGVPIDLKYRYTPPLEKDNSTLTVGINNQLVQAFRLKPSGKSEDSGHFFVPLTDSAMTQEQESLLIPAFQIGSNNQLQFQFVIDYHKQGMCTDTISGSVRSGIDPDSTIDLSGFPHYTAMPNLALFANAGFPFTKYADLAETAVVMPRQPAKTDIDTLLFLLGRMGRMTGVAAMRYQLVDQGQVKSVADDDLLIIGGGRKDDLLAQWDKSLPAMIEQGRRSLSPLSRASKYSTEVLGGERKNLSEWKVAFDANGPLAALFGFESPLTGGRSVVAIASSTPDAEAAAIGSLQDNGLVSQIRGDTVFIRGQDIGSYQTGNVYYVGHLSWQMRIWFYLSQHPLLLTLMGLLAGLLLAFWLYWYLRSAAARRMTY
ncbi:MAG TPA: cellulose biosynthesis cyclic di-GMP-binding regulatory protein BcsB [Stenotrophobium sp.]|nr:cellulose biosynthesis cyclic di-GMP-binding regulatory protein BcsB [Stenotrophobium sp.]